MKAAIITVSDGCYHGEREDASGPALSKVLAENQWEVSASKIVPDEIFSIQTQILFFSEQSGIDLIVTTGGTGISPRDHTPEAIRPLLEKEVDGLGELMRSRGIGSTDLAALSRSLAGVRNRTLILAVPGSPKGATESLRAVIGLLPHAIDLIQGRTRHD